MRILLPLSIVLLAANFSFAQSPNPYARILEAPTEIKRIDTDDKVTALLKQSYNATHVEIRIRYNYWLQGVGEIGGLLGSINRFQSLRLKLEPKPDTRTFAEQKLAFAKEIEAHTAKGQSKARIEAIRQIDESSTKAFRFAAELELEQLKKARRQKDRP